MKLNYQINVAFGILLVIVLSVTTVVIHYVLLDHFVGEQRKEMQAIGATMTASLEQGVFTRTSSIGAAAIGTMAAPVYAGVDAIITNNNGEVVSGVMPGYLASPVTTSISIAQAAQPVNLQSIWSGSDKRYIVEKSDVPQGMLTLITPLSKIKEVEQALLLRLLVIFSAGGLLMLLLSLFITRRLVKPLMTLKLELEKVKGRRFSEVKLVKAEGEMGSVARSVYEMANELERYTMVQKHFFQNASHELKTPLMSISGYAEGIRDGIFEGESIRKGLDIIMSESDRLRNIVTEMTLLAKLDSEEGIFNASEVAVEELLHETVERINPLAVKKGLTLHLDYNEHSPLTLTADRDKLLQALLNVAVNAIRYANNDIYIHAATNKGRLIIAISDDGPGISGELLPYLFNRFVKGKNGESGLGLAISRAIVERCGGLISADNRTEGGAIISLNFPITARTSRDRTGPGESNLNK